MERAGETVFSLCVGEPDYQPPMEVLTATAKAAELGLTKYTAVNGESKLRQAIAHDLTTRKATPYTADEILVSNGAKQAVIQALMAITCPGINFIVVWNMIFSNHARWLGDSVLIPAPYWPSYPDMVKMCGGTPVYVTTLPENNYTPTPEDLRETLKGNALI